MEFFLLSIEIFRVFEIFTSNADENRLSLKIKGSLNEWHSLVENLKQKQVVQN